MAMFATLTAGTFSYLVGRTGVTNDVPEVPRSGVNYCGVCRAGSYTLLDV